MSSRSRRAAKRALSNSRTEGPASGRTVLRATSISDLLGGVPALLGFHPRRSLVAIAMSGKQLGFRLRVDLPAPEHVDDAAEQLVVPLMAQEPDGVILIAYVEPEPVAGVRGLDRLAADGLVDAMRTRLAGHGVDVREAVRCDGSRYWSYVCDDGQCCPVEGTPYDVDASPMLASAVYNGIEVAEDREALERAFRPVTGARRIEMEHTTYRIVDEILAIGGFDAGKNITREGRPLSREPVLLRAGAEYVRTLLSDIDAERAATICDDDAARLSVWSQLIPVRDLAWSYVDRSNAAHHLQAWTSVVQRAVPPFEPAALSLAAFSAWLAGDGSRALCALDRVAEVDPDYSMAQLIRKLLSGFVHPDSWEPLDRAAILATIPDEDRRDSL